MMTGKKPNLFFQSLGCPKNLVDTEVMVGTCKNHGCRIVENPQEADFIVINTCSFINDAKKESIDTILELATYKNKGDCKKLIVTGCLPQRYQNELKALFPEVDVFLGTGRIDQLFNFIQGEHQDDFSQPGFVPQELPPRINSQPFFQAYLKIAEGCAKKCSFCIIPSIRGPLKSRSIPSLVQEAEQLIKQGVVELNLVAQNLTDYGKDLKNGTDLCGLLRNLIPLKDLKWIRLLYVYPDELSDELLTLMATEKKICRYLDLPIQHINDRILKLMNRNVSGNKIIQRMNAIRSKVPDISLRTSIMVGYPGETQEEFEELLDFIKTYRFDHLGVFAYSQEENTTSYFHPDQCSEEIKKDRFNAVMKLQQNISQAKLEEKIGQTLPILVEGLSKESEFLFQGRHEGQAPDIDGYVLIRGGNVQRGQFTRIKLEQAMEYDLIGIAETEIPD